MGRGVKALLAATVGWMHVVLLARTLAAQERIWQWFGDTQADRLGSHVADAGDVNGDAIPDVIVGIPDAEPNGMDSGQARIFSGSAGSILYNFDGAQAGDRFGSHVSSAGDVDGDGRSDLIVGAPKANGWGYLKVFSGMDGGEIHFRQGDAYADFFGHSVGSAGDVNGDGYSDFIAGGPENDNAADNAGMARVFDGLGGGTIYTFYGASAGLRLGQSVAAVGDVNGDSTDDFLIGAISLARLYSGADGSTIYTFTGDPNNNDLFGATVAGLGDLDLDGVNELGVGAPTGDSGAGGYSGTAYVFSGATGLLLYFVGGSSRKQRVGISIGGAHDVNADGVDDFIVGSDPDTDPSYALLYSGLTGKLLYQFFEENHGDSFGITVDGVDGDANGDGFGDVVIGAPDQWHGQPGAGSTTVFSGNDLFFQASRSFAFAGDPLSFFIRGGPFLGTSAIFVTAVNQSPTFFLLSLLPLDSYGDATLGGTVPSGLSGLDVELQAFACCPAGQQSPLVDSAEVRVCFR